MDIILYNIGIATLLAIIGYIFGSIPNGIWIGKIFFHKDPRDFGSKNSGGTNVGRLFGKKIGVLVIALDAIKVIMPIYVAWAIMTKIPMYNGLPLVPGVEVAFGGDVSGFLIKWPAYLMVFVGCTIGHCYPIFANFKGGKNVSAFMGFASCTSWLVGFIPAFSYFLFLKWKKMVSLASILTSWLLTLLSWMWTILILTGVLQGQWCWLASFGPSIELGYVHSIICTFGATVLTIRHSANIKRIREGTERKITWMK